MIVQYKFKGMVCCITAISILLLRAKEQGDYLIVALSADEFRWKSQKKRKMLLEAIQYVDLVIPEENWEQKEKISVCIMWIHL